LRLNRKHILLIVLALLLANVVFFYVKTRPKPPDVVLQQSLTWILWDKADRPENPVHLDKKGQWRIQDGKLANLASLAELTIPNIDSPNYWITVEQQKQWTLGDVVKTIRAASTKGICNLAVLDREMLSVDHPNVDRAEVPVLTVAKYSKYEGGPLTPCVTDPVINRRYVRAEKEYNRGRRDFTE
jgi:biopolymer transport protein ExbD